jgi:hypothetical protein
MTRTSGLALQSSRVRRQRFSLATVCVIGGTIGPDVVAGQIDVIPAERRQIENVNRVVRRAGDDVHKLIGYMRVSTAVGSQVSLMQSQQRDVAGQSSLTP